jgi:hypothetical protein
MENIDADHVTVLVFVVRSGPGRWSMLRFTTALLEKCGASALIRIDFPPSRLDWGAVRPCCRYFRESSHGGAQMGLLTKWLFLGQCPRSLQDLIDMTRCRKGGSVG